MDLQLVAPLRFQYSGLATGVLSGALPQASAEIDVGVLAAHFGVEHFATEAVGVDLSQRSLRLQSGQNLGFEAVSFNVGSVTRDSDQLAGLPGVWTAKPLSRLFDLRTRVEARLRDHRRSPALVVAGGGQSGFEIAAALAGLIERHGVRPDIQLVMSDPGAWAPPAAILRLTRTLERRGVATLTGQVRQRDLDVCVLSDGRRLACDMLVLATGLATAPILSALGLPLAEDGRLRVLPTLQSITDPAVFAVGDCARIDGAVRPAAGVFGVRAAPVLIANLLALNGGDLGRYHPQRRWLSIMDLGDGTGLAQRGPLWCMGRASLALKRHLDLGYIDRMRALSDQPLQD